uniref:Uncharacterized protein n=1 Tax=Trichobilharzia regenti TaxID=157069 RepID=A0AA85KE00_TRIRE|nr:unnamed protein product [Trichobilharzia regenti]
MKFKIFKEIIFTIIDTEINCSCDECEKRKLSNGITFFILKHKLWVETISNAELYKRLKMLNPQFEFQSDTLRQTIYDCITFGEVLINEVQPSVVVTDAAVGGDSEDMRSVCFQYHLGESILNWRINAVVPSSSSVLYCHIILPLSLAFELLNKKQAKLNNKLAILERHTNRLHEKLMLPISTIDNTEEENTDKDLDITHNFSNSLLSSPVTQNLFCEASRQLFTLKKTSENTPTSSTQTSSTCSGSSKVITKDSMTADDSEGEEEKRRSKLYKKLASQTNKYKSKEVVKRPGILRK